MSYDVPPIPGEDPDTNASFDGGETRGASEASARYPLWEVFVRAQRGLNHVHCGSLHAPDAETATRHARDVYTRRGEGVSLWVVRSSDIHASDPDDKDTWFDSTKPYRHPTFYDIPDEVGHM